MSRIVVVSNRVSVPDPKAKMAARAGGLGVAVQAMLRKSGGLWFGWSGEVTDKTPRDVQITLAEGITYATIDLTREDYDEYYNGFANRILWPLFHYRPDLATYNRNFFEGYLRVNAIFARHLAKLLLPDDLVWVHDYHLIPLGQQLRGEGRDQPLGFFLHVPFPAPQLLLTVPRHQALIRSLFAYDLVGFQTAGDLRAFKDYVNLEAGGAAPRRGIVRAYGKTARVGVFPIGIDPVAIAAMARSPAGRRQFARTRKSLLDRRLIIGVDRLDYSKGLHERMRAFERFLELYRAWRRQVVYLQVTPLSRTEVPEYREIRRDLERLTGHINGRFSDPDRVPIRYLNRSFTQSSLAGFYRAADIGLVTPFRDGMNLVAMEYVAAQDQDDPGVLILSKFAGAAQRLSGALIVNPYDIDEVAEAIDEALNMSLQARRDRWSGMIGNLRGYDLARWQADFANRLRGVRKAA